MTRGTLGWAEAEGDGRGKPRIRLHGEIDLSNVDQLRAAIDRLIGDSTCEEFVIDLTSVDYIDSQGVGLLVGLATRLQEQQSRLRVIAPAASFTGQLLRIAQFRDVSIERGLGEQS